MRNFKKFLALVLAMLMVSACAIGASAAFTDQSAVDASGYATAVSILNDLGVIQGKGQSDGTTNFDPNGTLTREEAAVIAAKLIAGNKNVAWNNVTTCRFADVTAKWSFGYIEYAADRGVLEGTGNGFNPKGTLSVAEATAIAVKLLGLQSEVAALDNANKPSIWYINYIDVANKYGLLNKVDPFSYTQNCSRAEMAQIAYNVLSANVENNRIRAAFNMTNATFEIASVKDGVVTMKTGEKFGEAALNTALANKGVDKTVADLKGAKVVITYSNDKIYGATLASDAYAFNYSTAELAVIKDANNNNTNKIKLGETTYIVADEDETVLGGVIGGQTTGAKAVKLTVDGIDWRNENGTVKDIPAFYAAVAYDDNNDGSYDRIVVKTYHVGTITVGNAGKTSENVGGTVYNYYTVSAINAANSFTNNSDATRKNIDFTGKEFSFGETPVLFNVSENKDTGKYEIDVLEVATTVTGKLTRISNANKVIAVEGTDYAFAAECVAPSAWTLNQTVSFYAIGGKYVTFTGASYVEQNIVVDSVSIVNGKAVVTGFNKNNNYAVETITIEGYTRSKTSSVLTSINAYANADTSEVRLATSASANAVLTFKEGGYYTLLKTSDGVYVVADNDPTTLEALIAKKDKTDGEFAVKGGYVLLNGTPQYYAKDDVVILQNKKNTGATAKNVYGQEYVKYTSTYTGGTGAKYVFLNDKFEDITGLGADSNNKVAFIYVSEIDAAKTYTTALAAGQTIVQILSSEVQDSTYSTASYKAVDILTGKAVVVIAKSSMAVAAGEFYLVDANLNVVGDKTTAWVGHAETNNLTVAQPGVVKQFNAKSTQLVNGTALQTDGNAKDFGLGVKIFKLNADRTVAMNGDGTAQTYTAAEINALNVGSYTVNAFINGNNMILFLTAAEYETMTYTAPVEDAE